MVSLRTVALLGLVFLVARPVWIGQAASSPASNTVVLLVDRSESMSLEENGQSRYRQVLDFMRDRLLPALKDAGLRVEAMSFAQDVEMKDGAKLSTDRPDGKRTNLGGAIARGLASASGSPLALIALTDGVANEKADNARGVSALVESRAPFIGVGFGSDTGVRTLSLRQVEAPGAAAPKTEFTIAAHLEAMNVDELPGFDLVLLRDGKFLQKMTIAASRGSRFWLETFRATESLPGLHDYAVQLVPPPLTGLKTVNSSAFVSVRIADEKELRILYVQGSLTWDYKFVSLALRGDPTIKLTGLTRTSAKTVFRQNIEGDGELFNGFPATLEELAPFRVVVLSNLNPGELTAAQQELLARFCGELGGGVLMIGGEATFDASWHGSRLEQLLPVVFAANSGVSGLDRPFQIQLTEEAMKHPVFQIEGGSMREAWSKLPTFTQYGRVDAAKPGAQIWALHPQDEGPKGRRILLAAQHYGAGLAAVVCVQNFWRWRLAKDSDPQQFDRFWRQLFRYLADSSRQEVAIHLADQELRPPMDVRLSIEKQPSPKELKAAGAKYFVRVEDSKRKVVKEQAVELQPKRPVDFFFSADKADIFSVSVLDANKLSVATRPVEIKELNVEFLNTARDMENLRQWAALSDGLAVRVEDCRDPAELVKDIQAKVEQVRRSNLLRVPVGMNGWVLTALLGSLGAEWLLRKKWGLA